MPTWKFSLRTTICFGNGAIKQLPALLSPQHKYVLLLTYATPGSLAAIVSQVKDLLEKAGAHVELVAQVQVEPSAGHITKLFQQLECKPDAIVALGGGSVIDAAKGISLLCQLPNGLDDPADLPADVGWNNRPTLIAMPTTFGTGSEVTEVAVFRYPSKRCTGAEVKIPISRPQLQPDYAIVDPALGRTLSCRLASECAIDAAAHAIEAFASRTANHISLMFASQAISRLLGCIDGLELVETPVPQSLLEELAFAATAAGVALNAAGLTAGHAMAHAVGGLFGLPHRLAVALTLPLGVSLIAETLNRRFEHSPVPLAVRLHNQKVSDYLFSVYDRLSRQIAARCRAQVASKIDEQTNPQQLVNILCDLAEESSPLMLKLTPRRVDRGELAQCYDKLLREYLNFSVH